jgi:septum formation protein
LIEALGATVEVRVSRASELTSGDPAFVALENARRKRDDIAPTAPNAIVIAADTIVVIDGMILGKPADLEEACAMIRRLSGRTHEVMSGVAVVDASSRRSADAVETTRVTFRALTEGEIERFVDAVRPLDRAGAYTVDGPGSLLVERYEGCYNNVLGLPLVCLDTLLRKLGDGLYSRIDRARARFL